MASLECAVPFLNPNPIPALQAQTLCECPPTLPGIGPASLDGASGRGPPQEIQRQKQPSATKTHSNLTLTLVAAPPGIAGTSDTDKATVTQESLHHLFPDAAIV